MFPQQMTRVIVMAKCDKIKLPGAIVLLLRDKIVRFLIKASNLAWLLTSIRQTFPDMEPRQIFAQNHGTRMSKIWHTRLLHGNEADAKYRIFWPSGTTMPSALLF